MRWPSIPTLIALSLLIAGSCAAMSYSPRWTEQWLIDRCHRRIEQSDEAAAAPQVDCLALYSDAALEPLVACLGDERRAVRQRAQAALSRRIADWLHSPSSATDRSVARLAAALARTTPSQDIAQRRYLRAIATQLLAWPLDPKGIAHPHFLTNCHTLLQHSLIDPGEFLGDAPVPQLSISSDLASRAIDPGKLFPELHDEIISPTPAPFVPVLEVPESLSDEDSPLPSESRQPALLPRPPARPLPPEYFEPQSPRRIRSGEQRNDLQPVAPAAAIDHAMFEQLSMRSLMRRLHDVPIIAAGAEAELRRRGMNDHTLVLARRLDDPDPRVRCQLAEEIVASESIDHAIWLWEVAADADVEVRSTALSILAASSNPATRKKASEQLQKITSAAP